jgi:hypothetical protein
MINLKRLISILALLLLALAPAALAQFGGGPGDAVIYALTYNGSGDFQTVPPDTANSAQNLASFKVTSLDSVPFSSGDPFPLQRQVFYTTPNETFQVGTDYENTVGLHRVFVFPVKIFEFEGLTNPFGTLLGFPNTLLSFPKGLDFEGDIALVTLKVITWFAGPWPFIVLTDQASPLRPPNVSGYQYFFQLPGAVVLPSLMPWTHLSLLYPGAGWQSGVDIRMLDQDPAIGDTIRQLRLGPGTQTPPFQIPGHTHLFVLQGNVMILPSGGSPYAMKKYDYAFLPENFSVTLFNPQQQDRPGAP